MLDGASRSKLVFLLTATPVNNRLTDFRHMAELFTRGDEAFFARSLGVNNLSRHFNVMERALQGSLAGNGTASTDTAAALMEGPDLRGTRHPRRRHGVRGSGGAAQPVLRQSQPRAGDRRIGRVPRAQAAAGGRVHNPLVVPERARHVRKGLPPQAAAVLAVHLLPARALHRHRRHPSFRREPPAAGGGPDPNHVPEAVREFGVRVPEVAGPADAQAARLRASAQRAGRRTRPARRLAAPARDHSGVPARGTAQLGPRRRRGRDRRGRGRDPA